MKLYLNKAQAKMFIDSGFASKDDIVVLDPVVEVKCLYCLADISKDEHKNWCPVIVGVDGSDEQ